MWVKIVILDTFVWPEPKFDETQSIHDSIIYKQRTMLTSILKRIVKSDRREEKAENEVYCIASIHHAKAEREQFDRNEHVFYTRTI